MTTNKDIELCAKALGIDAQYACTLFNAKANECVSYNFIVRSKHWNPRTDQANSDEMACDLEIGHRFQPGNEVQAWHAFGEMVSVTYDNTIEGRRAAVREARALVAGGCGNGESGMISPQPLPQH